jgi:signal transduction histidine kinase/PAS domain-containing protein
MAFLQQTPTPPTDDDGEGAAYTFMPPPSMPPLTPATTPLDSQDAHDAHDARDWAAALPQTAHVRFFRDTNWARTPLGPLSTWSPTLRLFTGFVLADARAACLWWGPEYIAIYNEHYAPLAAQVHPTLMGAPFTQGYPELWPSISRYFDKCRRTGAGVTYSSATPTLVERKGWTEETFFSGSFTPIGPAHAPEGFYNSTYEVTSQKLADRRTSMLNSLAAVPVQTTDAVFAHIVATLETNPRDIPLAVLYKYVEGAGENAFQLQGHFGLPTGHNLIVESAALDSSRGLVPDMRRAGSEALTIDYDERFDSASWRGWGAPSKRIAILPLTSGSRLFGYLVVGTNPYRPHDSFCEQFLRDLNRMVSSIVAAAVDSDSSKRRQEQLEADLAFSDLKLRHLIDHASVGMCHVSMEGRMLWANEHYYRLSGAGPEEHAAPFSFYDVYFDEDKPKVTEVWENLIAGVDHVTAEVRLKRMYEAPVGDPEPAQIQILAFPYRDPETGQVKSVMACTTDISKLKWAQTFQARLAAEAKEAKRQQEAFIDVVSHEMRNPLSAIVHCADAIASTLEEVNAGDLPIAAVEALEENAQSADVILQCANHQKRIIDDILTLSKLDSMLLSITPVAVRPRKLIDSIFSIFEAELKSKGIEHSVNSGPSIKELDIDYVYLDPSRVTQVFINLLTNAIKFVKPSRNPRISIRFGASLTTPRRFFPDDMFWATDSKADEDVTSSPDWGDGQEMYLTFTVRDSGIGLDNKEIHKIFERFRQANVKTHVKYGGSGLGLFISKELTEKQGGEIGVSSKPGQGSTFGFYVKTRRVEQQVDVSRRLIVRGRKQDTASEKLRVLLVEDNIINQQVLGKQLKKAGCMVNVANHGLEALEVLERQTFDVCLMDLEMPVSTVPGSVMERLLTPQSRCSTASQPHHASANANKQARACWVKNAHPQARTSQS